MNTRTATLKTIAEQPWVKSASKSSRRALPRRSRRSVHESADPELPHGVWLGHPLHPALTDVPIGAWTAAVTLDVLDMAAADDRLAAGADAAVALGLAGAVGSALTGLTDWHKTDGNARRIGMIHAVLNTTATTLYAFSLAARRGGNRPLGRGWLLPATASRPGGVPGRSPGLR